MPDLRDTRDPKPQCAPDAAQAERVFLHGNELPDRWQGRPRFVVLETGFGLGERFLATWAAWRLDADRCDRLFFISLEANPARAGDLTHAGSQLAPLAAQLQAQWPPRAPGWQRLDFEAGRVQLLLGFGALGELLPQVQAEVDAFFLSDPTARPNPAGLARLAAMGATVAAQGASAELHQSLRAAGFAPQQASTMTVARFTPPFRARQPAGLAPLAPQAREAVVLGAGLAGAACARALHEAGIGVQVFEATHIAAQASGNPGGLFHATVHADDGPHARWSRQAALRCRAWLLRHPPPWVQDGLLRLSEAERWSEREGLAARLGIDHQLAEPHARGWWFPSGGALPPGDWVRVLLDGLSVHGHRPVQAVRPHADGWQLLDANGRVLADTPLLVLAPGAALPALLAPLDATLAALLQAQRGQISHWPLEHGPAHPIAAGGYALALPGGGLLAGATAHLHDHDPGLRDTDQAHNRAVAERLLGRALPPPAGGRVAWRLLAPDKQPLVGGLIDPAQPAPTRATQGAHWPRRAGLLVCGALGSRGISSAPLAADLVVAQALGWPWPVPRNLAAAVDPARFAVRRVRHAAGTA